MDGRIHSIQTLGTLDGPGVRFVVFLQGCPLRCGCCHNPDTWDVHGGTVMSASSLAEKATRYRAYFGERGGVTLSGGEPLLQATFATSFFEDCHARSLNTCLDTSGCVINDDVRRLLTVTDRVLLDIKYPNEEQYRQYVGCDLALPMAFLELLEEYHVPTTIRQVIIPTLNDTEESMHFLKALRSRFSCVDGVELLPFKKICKVKYDELAIPFRFHVFETPTVQCMSRLQRILDD